MEYKSLPDLAHLATLRAVIEKGGVKQAAQVLHIGQPAVTKRLRALDKNYGISLLTRPSGRLQLTAAGEKVYQVAVQLLDRHALLVDELSRASPAQTRLRLEVTFAIGEHFLPDLLVRFVERYPQYKIDSRLGYGHQILAHLATGQAHLALLESAPDHPDMLVQKWKDDELVLVCGAKHRMANCDPVPVSTLTELSYVLRESKAAARDTLDDALHNIGITHLNVAMEASSTDTIVEILKRGKHVSFLPRFAVEERLHCGDLYHIKVSGLCIMRILWITRHRTHLDHPVAEAFIQLLREE